MSGNESKPAPCRHARGSRLIRRLAALALMVSFFLPLAQCTRKDAQGVVATSELRAVSAYHWPSKEAAATLALFAWPALAQLAALRRRQVPRHPWLALAGEVLLCALSAAWVGWLALWGHSLRYGAFVAWAALAAYLGAGLAPRLRRHR